MAPTAATSSHNAAVHKKFPTSWLALATVLVALFASYKWLDGIKDRWYVFDPESLNEITQRSLSLHAGKPNATRATVDSIVSSLVEKYGAQHINVDEEWIFSNAGGAMGAMWIVHASITEYLLIFGTPLGTEGHTGRHTVDDYFHIIEGEQWAFKAGSLEKEVYPTGTVHHLRRGEIKQYKMHENCFAFEYAAGWIPPMSLFGLADLFTSTLDVITLWDTIRITGREMIRNLLAGKI